MNHRDSIERVVGRENNIFTTPRERKKIKQKKDNPSLAARKHPKSARKSAKLTKIEQFCIDFAAELDLFDSDLGVPAWVFDYRDGQIRKTSREIRRIACKLREMGLRFKIKWPIEINGSWKFADFFFPRQKTVIIVSSMATNFRPMGLDSDRAEFFKERYRVVEIETYEDLQRKMRIKQESQRV